MKLVRAGSAENPPVVFLHGYGAHPELYREFVDRLAREYHVHIPEIFGLNGVCRRDFSENLAVLAAFMRKHELAESTVIGHSYGALAAMHLASEFPTLRRAIAVNPLLPELFNGNKLRLQLANLQRDLKYATGELRGMLFDQPEDAPYFLSAAEEMLCLESAIGAFVADRVAAREEGRAPPEDPQAMGLLGIAHTEGLLGYVMYEILGRHRPEHARTAPLPVHRATVAYIRKYVLGDDPEKSEGNIVASAR